MEHGNRTTGINYEHATSDRTLRHGSPLRRTRPQKFAVMCSRMRVDREGLGIGSEINSDILQSFGGRAYCRIRYNSTFVLAT
ncbi:hypothetical protein J2W42_006549 [Rhizobium tibeticum]|nr:hypothetical protein [Rhizobium tibeticum]